MVFVVMSYSIHGWGCRRHRTWCVDSPPFIHDIQYIVIYIIAFTISDILYAAVVSKGIHIKNITATSTNIIFFGGKKMLSVVFIFKLIWCFSFFGQWITLTSVGSHNERVFNYNCTKLSKRTYRWSAFNADLVSNFVQNLKKQFSGTGRI